MDLLGDLRSEAKRIFEESWTIRDGKVVPDSTSIKLSNDAVRLDGTVLYADLTASTALVKAQRATFAAEVYRAYLYCTAKIIRSEGGVITAYDGDRIMAVYIGSRKNTSAARTGLKVNWAVKNVINPAIRSQYRQSRYEVKQTIGIDTSALFVARTGIRGSNDLVWVGRAANYAAKLATLSASYPTRITKGVFTRLAAEAKKSGEKLMWKPVTWTAMGNAQIYCSNWVWKLV